MNYDRFDLLRRHLTDGLRSEDEDTPLYGSAEVSKTIDVGLRCRSLRPDPWRMSRGPTVAACLFATALVLNLSKIPRPVAPLPEPERAPEVKPDTTPVPKNALPTFSPVDRIRGTVYGSATPRWSIAQGQEWTQGLEAGPSAVIQGDPDQKKVDEAIRKGVAYLKSAGTPAFDDAFCVARTPELVLLALHCSCLVSPEDPAFQKHFKTMMDDPLESTYRAALKAIFLEEFERVKYQPEIWKCAQYFVDLQCPNGMWGYGGKIDLPPPPRPKPITDGRTASAGSKRGDPQKTGKPAVRHKLTIKRSREGCPGCLTNNSTAQYVILGLRSCHDAGIEIPRETIDKAIKSWELARAGAPKWQKRSDTPTGTAYGESYGWDYFHPAVTIGTNPMGSLTVGAVGSLVICDYIQGRDWRKNKVVLAGMNWLAENFSVTENPGAQDKWSNRRAFHYYYLYGLERCGILYGTETFGRHRWYREGATILLNEQLPDGSWNAGGYDGGAGDRQPVIDTCFALLFLKRATRSLDVATGVSRPASNDVPDETRKR